MSIFDKYYQSPNLDSSRLGSSQGPSNQSMQSFDEEDMEYDTLLEQFLADGVITDEERAVLSAASGSQATKPQEPVTFLPYADDVAPSRVNALSVFTPGGDLKPGIDVNAITPSPEMLPTEAAPKSALLEMLELGDERVAMGLPRQAAPGIIDAPSPVVDPFTGETIENPTPFSSNNSLPAGMTMNQAAIMNALPDQVQEREINQGMDINQQAISNALVQEETAPPTAQTLSQYLRYEDSPEQRTEQFVDEQGRLRFRPTQEALRLQAQPEATQVPVSALSDFERQSLLREARLAERDRRPGETQTQRDTRIAQSRTTGAQTEGLSFDEARRRAEGELAARGVRNPSASQVNALARSIQEAEPERLEALRIKTAKDEAKLNFEPKVVEIEGQKLIQLAPEYYQPVRAEPKEDEPFEPRILDHNNFTYFEIAPNRFQIQPSTGQTTADIIAIINEERKKEGLTPIEAPTPIETTTAIEGDAKGNKKLDKETARSIFNEAGGDAELARQIARERGFVL